MESPMLCKMGTKKRSMKLREFAKETTESNKKTKHACIVEAQESTRKRLESTLPRNHEDQIAEKEFKSISHCNLVHEFVPMPQAMNIPNAKPAVDKEWEKLEKLPAWQLDKVKCKKEVILDAQKREKQSPRCYIDGDLSSQECRVRTKAPEVQRTSRAPR